MQAETKKLSVGQTLYAENIDPNNRGRNNELLPVIVTKIGRKYFEVENEAKKHLFDREKFHIDTMWHDGGNYSAKWRIHIDQQAVLDEKEAQAISVWLTPFFGYGKPKLSLDKLRQIKVIITEQ